MEGEHDDTLCIEAVWALLTVVRSFQIVAQKRPKLSNCRSQQSTQTTDDN
jgi:hypothetical protein